MISLNVLVECGRTQGLEGTCPDCSATIGQMSSPTETHGMVWVKIGIVNTVSQEMDDEYNQHGHSNL